MKSPERPPGSTGAQSRRGCYSHAKSYEKSFGPGNSRCESKVNSGILGQGSKQKEVVRWNKLPFQRRARALRFHGKVEDQEPLLE